MSTNTLNSRTNGQTIDQTFFNDIHSSLEGDFVGRNTSGVPTASQNLGTTALPWGTARVDSLVVNGSTIDTSLSARPQNTITSGKVRSTSNQPAFLTPNGAAATAIIAATTTPLVLDINGSAVTVSADITLTGLTTAPSSNNTATVNNSAASSQHQTRQWGEVDSYLPHESAVTGITVTSMGTNITALVGKFASFKIVQGGNTEYFFAFVESTTRLSKISRGFFYNSSLAPINRIVFSNSAVITLMSTGWVFVENNGTTTNVSYTVPTWGAVAPSSPATGDYWYDVPNNLWKRYDGASFVSINRTLIGMLVIDSTNCVAARCMPFFKKYERANELTLEISTVAILRSPVTDRMISVNGTKLYYGKSLPTWNMTTDLATSADMYDATEQSSRYYYFYIKDTGATVISDIAPYNRGDLEGYYHPHNPWRCIGWGYNDGSSNLTIAQDFFKLIPTTDLYYSTPGGHGSSATKVRLWTVNIFSLGSDVTYTSDSTNGDKFTINTAGTYSMSYYDRYSAAGAFIGITKNSNSLTSSIRPNGSAITRSLVMGWSTGPSNSTAGLTVCFPAQPGDIIRTQDDGNSDQADTDQWVRITRIG